MESNIPKLNANTPEDPAEEALQKRFLQVEDKGIILKAVSKEFGENYGCSFYQAFEKVCERRRQAEEEVMKEYHIHNSLPLAISCGSLAPVIEDEEEDNDADGDDDDNDADLWMWTVCPNCGRLNNIQRRE